MLKEFEHYFKKMIKRKEKYTKALLITFLMTGALGFSVPITPNANGEYIVNSSTEMGMFLIIIIIHLVFLGLVKVKNLFLQDKEI